MSSSYSSSRGDGNKRALKILVVLSSPFLNSKNFGHLYVVQEGYLYSLTRVFIISIHVRVMANLKRPRETFLSCQLKEKAWEDHPAKKRKLSAYYATKMYLSGRSSK